MKLPEHLGITALQKYDECPRCFWLERIAGLADKPSPALALGREVHFGISQVHQRKSFAEVVGPEAYKLVKTYQDSGRMEVAGRVETEVRFLVPLVNPIAESEVLPFKLKGFIDGVDREIGWIFEYKTSANLWTCDDVASNLQATAYAYAYFMLYGELPVGIRFTILKKNKVRPRVQFLETYRTLEDFYNLWEWARGLADRMLADDFEPRETRFNRHHYLCPYVGEVIR